jgi:hypothetical protein
LDSVLALGLAITLAAGLAAGLGAGLTAGLETGLATTLGGAFFTTGWLLDTTFDFAGGTALDAFAGMGLLGFFTTGATFAFE